MFLKRLEKKSNIDYFNPGREYLNNIFLFIQCFSGLFGKYKMHRYIYIYNSIQRLFSAPD